MNTARYDTVKTVKSRTVSTGQKGSKSTYNCPKRYVNGKGKGKRSISVRKKPHSYGNSRAIWDHTVLPATRQR